MAADDSPEEPGPGDDEATTARERLEHGADRALAEFDGGVVDLLAWLLDTETRARIYVFLRQTPDATSEEVSDGTGLYPSTVREALADLHGEGRVTRRKRENTGAGTDPSEYRAIPPSDLVRGLAGEVQNGLDAVFTLDERLGEMTDEGDRDDRDDQDGAGAEPVRITVEDETDDDATPDGA